MQHTTSYALHDVNKITPAGQAYWDILLNELVCMATRLSTNEYVILNSKLFVVMGPVAQM